MVNPQLRQWINDQKKKGFSSKEIYDFMVQHGYKPEVAKQALGGGSPVMLIAVVVIVLLLGAGAGAMYFMQTFGNNSSDDNSNAQTDTSSPEEKNSAEQSAAETDSPESQEENNPGDESGCSSMDDLIEASKNCEECSIVHNVEMTMFGMGTQSTSKMEIRGTNDSKCVYFEKLKNISIKLDDATKQKMLEQGMTEEEIAEQEKMANLEAKKTIGSETLCRFEQERLTELLKKWQAGNYSMSDKNNKQCTTELPEGYN